MNPAAGGYLTVRRVWTALDNDTGPLCPVHGVPMVPDLYENLGARCCGLLIPKSLKGQLEDLWKKRMFWRLRYAGAVLVLERRPAPMPGLRRKG